MKSAGISTLQIVIAAITNGTTTPKKATNFFSPELSRYPLSHVTNTNVLTVSWRIPAITSAPRKKFVKFATRKKSRPRAPDNVIKTDEGFIIRIKNSLKRNYILVNFSARNIKKKYKTKKARRRRAQMCENSISFLPPFCFGFSKRSLPDQVTISRCLFVFEPNCPEVVIVIAATTAITDPTNKLPSHELRGGVVQVSN